MLVVVAPAELVATADGSVVVGVAATVTAGAVELTAYGYWVTACVVAADD